MKRIWLITKVETGFGNSMTRKLLKTGNTVIEAVRNKEKVDDLIKEYPNTYDPQLLDVTDTNRIKEVIDYAWKKYGKVDVVVSNAGYGLFGTADEVANIAEILLSDKGQFITGSDFLIDGGATASYFYGPLQPNK